MREEERSELGPSLLPAVVQMDGFNQGRPGGRGGAIRHPHPKLGPPLRPAASPRTPPPPAPFLFSRLLSVRCPAFCNLIFFPSAHLSSLCCPLPLCPQAGAPEAFQRPGPQPGASLPHWPPLRDALPQARAPCSVIVHGVAAASCLGRGFCSPVLWPQLLFSPHSFIHARLHSVRGECWGLCQEPCTALCCAGGTEYRSRYPQPLRGLMEGWGRGRGERGR